MCKIMFSVPTCSFTCFNIFSTNTGLPNPTVSASIISLTPIFFALSISSETLSGFISSPKGQPNTVARSKRNFTLGYLYTISSNSLKLSSTVRFTFALLWASLTEITTEITSAPEEIAFFTPFLFGQRTITSYFLLFFLTQVSHISLESIICGIHFGFTNEVISILLHPASSNESIISNLCLVSMKVFIFWKPSRGPTSTIWTFSGKFIWVPPIQINYIIPFSW